MRITGPIVALVLLILLSSTESAFAWGPATHVALGSSVLDGLALLPGALAAMLARNKLAYLYGNIAADVVFAKRWSRVKQSCHHWSTGFGMLDHAETDDRKAFAYGYLSHLAADTVAHTKYVPRQLAVSNTTLNFGHLYWELRADALVASDGWQRLRQTLEADLQGHLDGLKRHVNDTFLPHGVNRFLFQRINAVSVSKTLRRTVGAWERRSRWQLAPTLVERYRSECVDRIRSILVEGTQSALVREDPNGTSALMRSHALRRESRRLLRRGISTKRRQQEMSRGVAPECGTGRENTGKQFRRRHARSTSVTIASDKRHA